MDETYLTHLLLLLLLWQTPNLTRLLLQNSTGSPLAKNNNLHNNPDEHSHTNETSDYGTNNSPRTQSPTVSGETIPSIRQATIRAESREKGERRRQNMDVTLVTDPETLLYDVQ